MLPEQTFFYNLGYFGFFEAICQHMFPVIYTMKDGLVVLTALHVSCVIWRKSLWLYVPQRDIMKVSNKLRWTFGTRIVFNYMLLQHVAQQGSTVSAEASRHYYKQ